jgi:hypothetical protein
MVKTQIPLSDKLHRDLKAFAAEENVSFAEFARRTLAGALATRSRVRTKKSAWTFPEVRDTGRVLLPVSEWRMAANERPAEDLLPELRKRK